MRTNDSGKSGRFLTILGIAIGVASVMTISEIGRLGINLAEKEILNMGVNSIMISSNKEYAQTAELDTESLDKIISLTENAVVSPMTLNYSKAEMRGLSANAGIIGADSNLNEIFPINLMYGRLFNKNDLNSYNRVCVIDEKMAEDYYERKNIVGKTLNIKINEIEEEYKIIGIVKSGGTFIHEIIKTAAPYIAYVPYTCIQQITQTDTFSNVIVKIKDPKDMDYYVNKLDNGLNFQNKAFYINNMASQSQSLSRLLNNISKVLSGIAGISLVVSGMSIMTVMLICVKEKTFEIGIKKAIGAGKGIIVMEFTFYACRMCVKGILYGLTTSAVLIYLLTYFLNIKFSFDLNMTFKIVAITFMITIIFSAYPTWKAASLKPIDALKTE